MTGDEIPHHVIQGGTKSPALFFATRRQERDEAATESRAQLY
jgi:hypothetical protein